MNQLQTILKARGRSMYWLANKTKISYNAIHRLVKSASLSDNTRYGTLKKLSNALDVGIDDLEAKTETK